MVKMINMNCIYELRLLVRWKSIFQIYYMIFDGGMIQPFLIPKCPLNTILLYSYSNIIFINEMKNYTQNGLILVN